MSNERTDRERVMGAILNAGRHSMSKGYYERPDPVRDHLPGRRRLTHRWRARFAAAGLPRKRIRQLARWTELRDDLLSLGDLSEFALDRLRMIRFMEGFRRLVGQRVDYVGLARSLIKVEPMPDGVQLIYDMSLIYKAKHARIGYGLFARFRIKPGTLVIRYTGRPGKYLSTTEVEALRAAGNDYALQVDDDLFFAAPEMEQVEDVDYLNHSCDPNCGIVGNLDVVAMRMIEPGEEITIDYAMTETSEYRMTCFCGQESCRREITGEDWRRPDLQERYHCWFSDYIRRRLEER